MQWLRHSDWNPPYITYRGKEKTSIKDDELKILIKHYKKSAEYKVNSYALFIEEGLALCRTDGNLSYIIPGSILQNCYLKKIRRFLLTENQIKEIVMFDNRIFDAVTDSLILRCNNGYKNNNIMSYKRVKDLSFKNVDQQFIKTEIWNNIKTSFVIDVKTKATDCNIFLKMESFGLQLGDIYNVYVGIVANGIKKFLYKTKETDNFKKYLQGKHIAPYIIKYNSIYIDFQPNLLHSNTDRSVYEQSEKILVRKTGNVLLAVIDNEQYYTDQSIYNLYLKTDNYNNKICCAILNSKLLNYYFNKKLITNAEVFPYIKGLHLKQLPLPLLSDKNVIDYNCNLEFKISQEVDRITLIKSKDPQANIEKEQEEIDILVYHLYGLTYNEVLTIDPTFEISKDSYMNV